MSIAVIGGIRGMEDQYRKQIEGRGIRAKIFNRLPPDLDKRIRGVDGILLFQRTVSHCLAAGAVRTAKQHRIPLIRCNSGSLEDLRGALMQVELLRREPVTP